MTEEWKGSFGVQLSMVWVAPLDLGMSDNVLWFVRGVLVGHTEYKPLFCRPTRISRPQLSLRVSEVENGLSKTHSDP